METNSSEGQTDAIVPHLFWQQALTPPSTGRDEQPLSEPLRGGGDYVPLNIASLRAGRTGGSVQGLLNWLEVQISGIDGYAHPTQISRQLCVTLHQAVEELNSLLAEGKLGDSPSAITTWPLNCPPKNLVAQLGSEVGHKLARTIGKAALIPPAPHAHNYGTPWKQLAIDAVICAYSASVAYADVAELRRARLIDPIEKPVGNLGRSRMYDTVVVCPEGRRLILPCWFELCSGLPAVLRESRERYMTAAREILNYHLATSEQEMWILLEQVGGGRSGALRAGSGKKPDSKLLGKVRERVLDEVRKMADRGHAAEAV